MIKHSNAVDAENAGRLRKTLAMCVRYMAMTICAALLRTIIEGIWWSLVSAVAAMV